MYSNTTTNIMSTTQLHNPKSAYFLGAPVSKAIAFSTAIVYVVAEMKHWHAAMVFGETLLTIVTLLKLNGYSRC